MTNEHNLEELYAQAVADLEKLLATLEHDILRHAGVVDAYREITGKMAMYHKGLR